MDSKKSDRIKLIQQALQDQKAIHLREMAALLDVSEMTLRRDKEHQLARPSFGTGLLS